MVITTLECKEFNLYINDSTKPMQVIKLNGTTARLNHYEQCAVVDGVKYPIKTFFADRDGVEMISHKEAFHRYGLYLKTLNIDPAEKVSFAVPPVIKINIQIDPARYIDFLDFEIAGIEEEINCLCNDVSSYLQCYDFDTALKLHDDIKSLREKVLTLSTERENIVKAHSEILG